MLLAIRRAYICSGGLYSFASVESNSVPTASRHADDFAQSKVSDSLLVGFLGSLETHCNSEEMRGVVHGFPKLDFEGRPHFCSIRHNPTSACLVLFRRGVFCIVPFV